MHSKDYIRTSVQNKHGFNIYTDINDYIEGNTHTTGSNGTNRRVWNSDHDYFVEWGIHSIHKDKAVEQFTAEISCASILNRYCYVSNNAEDMFVDWNTVTMNTPEVDFSLENSASTIPTENLKLRIIGLIPLTSNANDIYVNTSTPPIKTSGFTGLYNTNNNHNNISYKGSELRLTKFDWYDYHYRQDIDNIDRTFIGSFSITATKDFNVDAPHFYHLDDTDSYTTNYNGASYKVKVYKDRMIYPTFPWQGTKSLVGQYKENEDSGIFYSALRKKIISNIRTAAFTYYFPKKALSYDIGNVGIYTGDLPLVKLTQDNNNVDFSGMFNYYGEVDTILNNSNYYQTYRAQILDWGGMVYGLGNLKDAERVIPCGKTNDPIRMKYKSSPHLACHLNYTYDKTTKEYKQELLPSFKIRGTEFGDQSLNDRNMYWSSSSDRRYYIPGWSKKKIDSTSNSPAYSSYSSLHQSTIDLSYPSFPLFDMGDYMATGYMYIGEFYKDTPSDLSLLFGGKTSMAFEKNQWHTAGPSEEIVDGNDLTVQCLQGDTYYQRYDSLKTYPYTSDDPNQIIEILSFMCETKMNIDGRYDNNRGLTSNLYMNKVNFNLFNPAYTQQDNFFNYYYLDPERNAEDAYPNGFLWTKSKTMGEEIDTWSNINTLSSYSLDGDKGNLYALINWNDTLMSFQENGIARIMYNDRVQVATNDGTPIELTNSTKVSGKQYMSNTIGCTNKRTIQITSNGVYFMDGNSKDLYIIGSNINSLSMSKGFNSYFYNKDTSKFRTFYDEKSSDIYFLDDNECLTFNESLNEFVGTFDYGGTDYMFNYGDSFVSVKNNSLWKQYAGDYNMFFGKYKPFWLTLISNAGNNDKTFSNLEFEADSWHSDNTLADTTFDHLSVWDEYQMGESVLRSLNTNVHYHFSNLKRKFRIWRANIPRELKLKNITFPDALNKMQAGDIDLSTGKILNMTEGLNRIRNTWAYIRLKKYKENTDKTTLHSIKVGFFN